MVTIAKAMVVAGTLVPSAALAHPEHASAGGFGVLHYLTDPFHIGLAVAAVVVALAVRGAMLRRPAFRRQAR